MSGLRPLLRLAVRDARRDRWRSLLVLVIVALPVAGLVAAVTLTDSGSPTAEQNAVAGLGRADVAIDGPSPADGGPLGDAALLAAIGPLPAGSDVEVQRTLGGTVAAGGVTRPVTIHDADHQPDAISTGQHELVDGTFPTSTDAVALSTALLASTGAELGDRLVVDPLGEVTVVGAFRAPEHLSRESLVVASGTLAEQRGAAPYVLVDLPDGVAATALPATVAVDGAVDGVTDPAFRATSRANLLEQRFTEGERFFFIIVGGLAAVEVALVAGAAFAVSVRRRQRELGLLAATGGTRRHVRRSVLLTGLSIGFVGAVAGVVVGLVGSWFALPVVSRVSDRVVEGLRVDPVWIVAAAALGLAAALAGAWWPARSVARLPVLTALSGRRPTPAPATGGLLKGLLLVAIGVGLCLLGSARLGGNPVVFLAGAVGVVLGAGLTSPWLLEQLGRTARFLPVGPRLAVRDAARFRTRNGPIVTAAMAGLAASITVSAVVVSIDTREAGAYQPSLPDDVLLVQDAGIVGAADAVARSLGRAAAPLVRPVAAVVAASEGSGPDGTPAYEWFDGAVVDPATAAALAGPSAADHLAAGRAVALHPTDASHVEVRPEEGEQLGEPIVTIAVAIPEPGTYLQGSWQLPQLLLPDLPTLADTLVRGPDAWVEHVVAFDGPVDEVTYRTATRAAAEVSPDVSVAAERGYRSNYRGFELIATWVGGLAGLAIVAVAIALAATESRPDLRTLSAVGAGRRTRRALAAGRALLLSGLGGLLAVPVGLLPAASLLTTLVGRPPLVVPWRAVLVVAVLVPLLATAAAVVASRREPGGLTRAA